MLVDTTQKIALDSVGPTAVLGLLRPGAHGDVCTGTINGINKEFTVPNGPIFPQRRLSIAPQPADVTVYTLKGSTYTEVTVDSIKTTTDSETDIEYYGIVELHTAPEAASADAVYCVYVEELIPYKLQNIKDDMKQDTKEVAEIGNSVKQTSYGAKARNLTLESIVADLSPAQLLAFEAYDGVGSVETGYDAYDEVEEPSVCWAYENLINSSGFVGRIYYKGRINIKELFSLKVGDNPTQSFELGVDERTRLIVAEPS